MSISKPPGLKDLISAPNVSQSNYHLLLTQLHLSPRYVPGVPANQPPVFLIYSALLLAILVLFASTLLWLGLMRLVLYGLF